MTPAETLRAAAERVRELAAKATPTPWRLDGPWWHDESGPTARGSRTAVPALLITAGEHRRAVLIGPPASRTDGADLQWAITLSPAIAEPLAVWLYATADLIDSEPVRPVTPKRPALALARAILGDQP